MLGEADGLAAFRTYPHVDMADTGEHAARLLLARLEAGANWHRAERRLPFLIPINGMCTLLQPSRGVYEELAQLEQAPGVVSISFAPGFPPPTSTNAARWSGPTAPTRCRRTGRRDAVPARAGAGTAMVARLPGTRRGRAPRPGPGRRRLAPGGHRRHAGQSRRGRRRQHHRQLRALVEADAQNAALGLFYDPEVVGQAVAAGVGARLRLRLGGQSGVAGDGPSKASSRSRRFRRAGCALTAP
ncbi:M81 family metallopeptidase [Achromobacter xylosoxidans]